MWKVNLKEEPDTGREKIMLKEQKTFTRECKAEAVQLVMFFEGIRSERQLMRHAADRLSVRWYLGYDLNEALVFPFESDQHSQPLWH